MYESCNKHKRDNSLLIWEHEEVNETLLNKYPFNEPLKAAVWLYFILLIFEGALRKWVFPALSTPISGYS